MGLLRFLLAISVVVSHTSNFFGVNFIGGKLAVELFFIISGFYMTMILTEKYIGKDSIIIFFKSRIIRLFPPYLVILLLQIIVCIIALYTNPEIKSALTYFIYNEYNLSFNVLIYLMIENVILIGQESIFFISANQNGNLFFTTNFSEEKNLMHHYMFMPQSWSVAVELLFYLVAPFILTRKIKQILFLTSIPLILGFILMKYNLFHDPWNHRFLPFVIFYFLLGYYSYKIYSTLKKYNKTTRPYQTFKMISFFLLVINILTIVFYYKLPTLVSNEVKYGLFVFGFALSIPLIFEHTKNNKWDRYIGELSYPIYISHLLIVFVVMMYSEHASKQSIYIVPLTILFSIILNELFIRRLESFRQRKINSQLS